MIYSVAGHVFLFLCYLITNIKLFIITYICFTLMNCKLLPIALVMLCATNLHAQDSIKTIYPPNERFGVKEGLSQGLVMSIIQDKEGYMWFGTGDGLNKYDGYSITVYRNDPDDKYSLPENSVSELAEDQYGNFWVATSHKGLYLFDKKTERFYPTPVKTELSRISLLVCGDKLLMNTFNDILIYAVKPVNLLNDTAHINENIQLLFSYDAVQKNKAYKVTPSDPVIKTWMPDCSFWAVLSDTVLHYLPVNNFKSWQVKGYSFHTMGLNAVSAANVAMAPVIHSPGRLLIFSNNNLSEFDEQESKIVSTIKFPASIKTHPKTLNCFSDSIFLFNNDKDLFVFNYYSKTVSKWDMQQQIPNMCFNYSAPFRDAGGISWFGSSGWGALRSDLLKQHFTSYSSYQTATDIYFTKLNAGYDTLPRRIREFYAFDYDQITQDKRGIFWMYGNLRTTDENRLISFDPATKIISRWPGLPDNFTLQSSIYNDPQDRLWISASDKAKRLMIYQISKQTGKPLASWQLPSDDKWWGNSYIMQWWQDAHQVFWLATVHGLYSFDFANNKWKHWLHRNGDSTSISTDWLYTLCVDPAEPERYIWLGTNGNGFDKFDMLTGKCIKHYTIADGLPNNVVYGILPDKAGNLWLSTNKGLSCFNPLSIGERKGVGLKDAFRNFSQEDGLSGDEFNHFQFMKLKNGELLFGGVEGFTVFDPATVLQKQDPVPVVFTALSISNRPVNWKRDSNILSAPISYAKTITLHPGQNMFTISFASLEYRSNQKKFYKYRLGGFDRNWTEPTNKNEATYTNLSPGAYTFQATATNSDGVWNSNGISIQVVVLPYWYQTYWFAALVLLIGIIAVYSLYRFRINQVIKLERLRNRIAGDLHDEIGSTLSSISLYGASAQKLMNRNEEAHSILSKINANTSEMMEAISDIVWAINTRNDGMDNLANRMRNFAVQLTESQNIELHFTENKNLPSLPLDMAQRKNIYLVFKEAVNNAAKYAACKNLWIEFTTGHHILQMNIKDDGKGFDTRTSLSTAANRSFGGNGIINMKNRAAEIKGLLDIASEEGKGTSVILKVRLKKS